MACLVVPSGLKEYLDYVVSLAFDEKPDYERCRNILREGLRARGYRDDGKLVFTSATPVPPSRKPKSRLDRKVSKRKSEELEKEEDSEDEVIPAKKGRKARKASSKVSVQSTNSEDLGPDGEKENSSKNSNRKVAVKKGVRGKKVQPPKVYEGVVNPTPQMLALMQKKL